MTAAAHMEQHSRDLVELDALRAEVALLRRRLALAQRVALIMADREAASRRWAERLEAEYGWRGGFVLERGDVWGVSA